MALTDEQRDEAIVAEAEKLHAGVGVYLNPRAVALHALRLQREGWEPVDEDAKAADRFYLEWTSDKAITRPTKYILKAIKYGREQEHGA